MSTTTDPQPPPCHGYVGDDDPWFSNDRKLQAWAANQCDAYCPMLQRLDCEKEGWKHEFGVWGGLTPVMRRRKNPGAFADAEAASKLRSLEIDDDVVEVQSRAEFARMAFDAAQRGAEVVFEFDPIGDLSLDDDAA